MLETAVASFMSSASNRLYSSLFLIEERVLIAQVSYIPSVATINFDLLARQQKLLETKLEDLRVGEAAWKWTINPNDVSRVDANCHLIRQARPFILV